MNTESTVQYPLQSRNEAVIGVSFNPSRKPVVDLVKKLTAELMDVLDSVPVPPATFMDNTSGTNLQAEYGRWMSLAKTHLETASMFAVKALVHNPNTIQYESEVRNV